VDTTRIEIAFTTTVTAINTDLRVVNELHALVFVGVPHRL